MESMSKSTLKPWNIPVRGDLYTFASTTLKIGIEWACIKRHYDDKDLWFMVPFDHNSWVGTWDIAVSEFSETGMGTLRCGGGIWLHVDDIIQGSLMRDQLDQGYVSEATERLSAMVHGLTPISPKPFVDEHPEYQDWIETINAAGDLLELTFQRDVL